jgi:integrase
MQGPVIGGTGLYCEVRATSPGQGTYYLRYNVATGKTCHQKLGRTIDIELDEARTRTKKLKAEITLGKDPRADEKARKAVLSFDVFFREHYLPHAKVHKRGWKKDSQLYDLRLKQMFGNKRLNQIRRHEIQSQHADLRNDGLSPAYADRFLALLRHALNLAVDWDMMDRNPAVGVKLFNPDNRVEHYLDDDELKRLMVTLRTDRNRPVCSIALFLLSTGARLNEALHAQWKKCDRDNRVWRIPASTSKSKRVRSVPLNDSAINVLDLLDTEGKYEHLFINRRTGKPYTTIHKAWERLRNDAGLPHLRIHDLRHMYASFLVNSGRTLYEVKLALGHSSPIVTQRYAHLSTKSLQEAASSASGIITGAMPESN